MEKVNLIKTKDEISIGLNNEVLEKSASILNSLLANEYVLYTKVRNFHWNVRGPNFNDLHKFFEETYDELNIVVDDTAERIRALGQRPYGSLKEMLENSDLFSENMKDIDSDSMLNELLSDYELLIQRVRDDIEKLDDLDNVSDEDYLTGLLQQFEKKAWMLRSMSN
jgi:starvation-inducible DNA-binding protein